MKKGISFFYGYPEDKTVRAKKIKDVGFDCVMTNQDPRFEGQNGTIEEQMQLFHENGLGVSSLHNRYISAELPDFWKDNAEGERLENVLCDDILTAKKYGFKCVVVHMIGEYSKVGEERLKRVLDLCEKSGVFLAVENINHPKIFFDIFEKIEHPYLKFCYDSGHNNCFDPEYDYLENFGDKLVCLHLHDNLGKADDHTLKRFGTIDWDKLAQKLAKLDLSNVSLDYEMLMHRNYNLSADEVLQETMAEANYLEAKILEAKQNLK